jgi:hypothetical protein
VGFPYIFLSCKANARVKTRKDEARPALFHISCYLCCSVVVCVVLCIVVCKCVLPPGDNPIAVKKYIITLSGAPSLINDLQIYQGGTKEERCVGGNANGYVAP